MSYILYKECLFFNAIYTVLYDEAHLCTITIWRAEKNTENICWLTLG